MRSRYILFDEQASNSADESLDRKGSWANTTLLNPLHSHKTYELMMMIQHPMVTNEAQACQRTWKLITYAQVQVADTARYMYYNVHRCCSQSPIIR